MPNKNNYKNIQKCRLCNSVSLNSFINFDNVALGNNLQSNFKKAKMAEEYPLEVLNCQSCNHFQLSCSVRPEILYATNYTYLSGIGKSFVKHLKNYVKWIENKVNLSRPAVVVDVGSNDGSCLSIFKKNGHKVCGVDPARLPAKLANKRGIFTINEFFNEETLSKINNKFGKADLVTSQNVLAHVNNLKNTFENIYNLLKDNGHLIFEVGYFKKVLEMGFFDTIYHEHLDYHHATSLVKFLNSIGFEVVSIEVNKVQGGSLRILSKKSGLIRNSQQVKKFIEEEKTSIIYDKKILKFWAENIFKNSIKINNIVKSEKLKGKLCYAYGSPTKATLLLKISKLSNNDIEFVVEDNEYKVGSYLPKIGIPVLSIDKLNFNKSCVILILAWNFSEDIIKKLKKLYKVPIKIIIPLPKLKVLEI